MADFNALSRFIDSHAMGADKLERTQSAVDRAAEMKRRIAQEEQERLLMDAQYKLGFLGTLEQNPDYALKLQNDPKARLAHEGKKKEYSEVLGVPAVPIYDLWGEQFQSSLDKLRQEGIDEKKHLEDLDMVVDGLINQYGQYLTPKLSREITASIDNPQQQPEQQQPQSQYGQPPVGSEPPKPGQQQPPVEQTFTPAAGSFGLRNYIRETIEPYFKPRTDVLTNLMNLYNDYTKKANPSPYDQDQISKLEGRISDIVQKAGLSYPQPDDLLMIKGANAPAEEVMSPKEELDQVTKLSKLVEGGADLEVAKQTAIDMGLSPTMADMITDKPIMEPEKQLEFLLTSLEEKQGTLSFRSNPSQFQADREAIAALATELGVYGRDVAADDFLYIGQSKREEAFASYKTQERMSKAQEATEAHYRAMDSRYGRSSGGGSSGGGRSSGGGSSRSGGSSGSGKAPLAEGVTPTEYKKLRAAGFDDSVPSRAALDVMQMMIEKGIAVSTSGFYVATKPSYKKDEDSGKVTGIANPKYWFEHHVSANNAKYGGKPVKKEPAKKEKELPLPESANEADLFTYNAVSKGYKASDILETLKASFGETDKNAKAKLSYIERKLGKKAK